MSLENIATGTRVRLRSRRSLIAASAMLAALALAEPLSAQASAPPADALAEQREFTMAASSSSFEFDPHHAYSATEAQIFTALHEGLYVIDSAGLEPQPALAERVTRSKDRRVYTFMIRRGARFSNGDMIRASDVRDSWLRMLDPAESAEYSSLFDVISGARDYRTGAVAEADKVGIRAVSDLTLEVTLEEPTAYFLKLVCHHSFSVLHSAALKPGAWDAAIPPPVSGPYAIESRDEKGMRLVRNRAYWDASNALLPSIRVVFSSDDKDVTARFNAGEIQWLSGGVEPSILLDHGAIQLTLPMFATNYLYFRADSGPWSDPLVRKALLLLLPWEQVRSEERYKVPAKGLIVPIQGYPGAKASWQRDPGAALEALKKAGIASFSELPELIVRLAESEDHEALGAILEKAWSEAGVRVRIVASPGESYLGDLKGNDYAIGAMTWIGDFADPLSFLQMWTSGSNLNDARLEDPAFDSLIARSMSEEGAVRLETLASAERLLLDGGACIPIYHPIAVNVISPKVIGGWTSNPLDVHPFKYLYFRKGAVLEGIVKAF